MSGIMNMFVAAKTTIATAVDAFFNLTTLLLNTSSTNGAQNNTFLDSSTNNFTITRNGNATQGTFTPFSQTGWSNYFDGSGDYFSLASNTALTPASSTYTFECWVYRASSGAMTIWDTSVTNGFYVHINGSDKIVLRAYGTADIITSSLSAPVNSWFHVAVARGAANSTKMWINGSSTDGGSATDSTTYAAATTYIGIYDGSTVPLTGYISNLRLVKGSDVYGVSNSTITPPTAPLTAITNTSILTCQSNRFLDNSTNAFALTVAGNPSVQAFSPFAPTAAYDAAVVGGSGYFDGSGDFLTVPAGSAFAPGTGDFTVDGWIYPTSGSAIQRFYAQSTSGTNYFLCEADVPNKTIRFIGTSSGGGTAIVSAATLQLNAWNNFCISRTSGTVTVWCNGSAGTPTSNTTNFSDTSYTPTISGYSHSTGSEPIIGYLSGLRYVKGTALSGATVPTSPPTAVTNTSLLTNFTNSGIFDSTAKNDLETVGNAQVSTTQAKWGTTSMYFDGTGDNLYTPNACLPATGDFTLEMWVYPASTSGYQLIYSQFINGNSGSIQITWNDISSKFAMNDGSGVFLTSSSTYSTNAWYHLAIVRTGSTFTMYVNGTSVASGTNSYSILQTASYIGTRSLSDGYFNGYIDDIRITRGYARYTANFTAPTAAFPLQ
jgi:hypothetical protein